MNAKMRETPGQERCPFEISPALEAGSTAPLSTHWIPLHELIEHWTAVDSMLTPAPVAPVLAAIGHALFALSRETRALRLYTLAWTRRWDAPFAATSSRFNQAGRHLHDAAHQWSRAATALDSLLPTDLDTAALERARRLSRVARAQQARLWKLTDEVRGDVQAWRSRHHESREEGR